MLRNRSAVGRRLLIGVALLALFGSGTRAASFQTLFSFNGGAEGANPYYAGVIQDPVTRNLYGTTYHGGRWQYGVVFRLASDGTETVLHSFAAGGDGRYPASGVIRDSRGNLYGTTTMGGANGSGTVFKITTSGKEKLLHSFEFSDGATPIGPMVINEKGILYGTTWGGGTGDGCCGTIFKIAAAGKFSVLYNFFYGTDGYDNTGIGPAGGLTIDTQGQLYGTAYSGGRILGLSDGTVFRLSPKGAITVLHTFGKGTDGAHPRGGVIRDSSGNLYGTTEFGGTFNLGTVYKLTRSGKNYAESVLYSFTGQNDGETPEGPLYVDISGNLYGTTSNGGDPNYCRCGTVFKLTPDGSFTILHQFTYATDGGILGAGLIADGQGNLYSTANGGGAGGAGTVFQLTD